MTRTLFVVR